MERTGTEFDGIRLLVVEDDSDTRELLRFLLEQQGATVTVAENVPIALQLFETKHPDVVVTDIGMADYNGYALIAAIRQQEKEKGVTTPVIALTAFATPADRDIAFTSGFNAYMSKPFDPRKLITTIRTLYRQFHPTRAA